jgi:hypothetical protein
VALFDFISLKNDVSVPSKSRKIVLKISFLLASSMSMTKIAGSGSGSTSQRHGSADPDPPQNFMDPEHCFVHVCLMGLKNIRRKNQCFGSRSGLDPDSIRSMNLDPGGQQLPTKIEEISCFQVLDVLF